MTATARESVFERLERDGRFVEALQFALDRRVNPSQTDAIECPEPGHHAHGERTSKSGIVCPDVGGVKCATTGHFYGLAEILVVRGKASSDAEAARLLEEEFYGPAHGRNGHANGKAAPAQANGTAAPTIIATRAEVSAGPARTWPYFTATIRDRLGWDLVEDEGEPAIRASTWHADGTQGKTKVRWQVPRGGLKGPRARFLGDAKRAGFLNLPRAAEYVRDYTGDAPTVVYASSETDIAAWTAAAAREGIDVPAFGSATGEGTRIPLAVAVLFKGCRVLIFADRDDTGRREAPKRAEEFRAGGALPEIVETPEGTKDIADHVLAGGKVAPFLAVAPQETTPAEPAGLRTGTELLAAYHSGEIAPRPVLVLGLMRRGDIVMLFGPAGMGKTQLAIALAVALSVGGGLAQFVIEDDVNPLWELVGEEPIRVLLVNGEDDEADLAERLSAHVAARGLSSDLPNLYVYTPKDAARNLATAGAQGTVEALVRDHAIDVLLVDNLTNVLAGLEKSDEGEVTKWINGFPRRLRDAYGVASVLLGHANKGTKDGDARSALDRLFGSMAWGACADGAVMLDWIPGEPHCRRLIHAKARGFAPFDTMKVEAPRGDCIFPVLGIEDEMTGPAKGPAPKVDLVRFREALSPVGTWVSSSVLCERLGVTDRTLRRYVNGDRGARGFRAVLGDELGERDGDADSPAKHFRLVPLEERDPRAAAREGNR